MPQIPKLTTQSINTNAVDLQQGPSVQRAGMVANAWGDVGGVLASIGNDLMAKRKQAETSTFINSSRNELNRQVSMKETELTEKYSGDPTGYASEMNEFLNDFGNQFREKAPNEDAKLAWENDFNTYANNIGIQAESKENKNRAIYQSGLIDEDAYKNRQIIAQKPDVALATDFFNNSLKSTNDGIGLWYDETSAKEKAKKLGADYAGTLLEGFENNKDYGNGLRFLEGKDPNGKALLEYTDPKLIQGYKDRFQRLQEQETQLSKAMLNTQVSDVTNALLQGKNISNETLSQLANKASMLRPEEQAYMLDNISNAKVYNEALKDLKTRPLSEMQQKALFEIPRGQDDSFNFTDRQNMSMVYQKAAANIIKQKVSDYPQFLVENDPQIKNLSEQVLDFNNVEAMRQYATSVSNKSKLEGIPNNSLISEGIAKQYGSMITSKNPEAANSAYKSIEAGFGSHTGQVISDMVKHKAISDDHAMALYLKDDAARVSSLANIAQSKQIDESFKKNFPREDYKDIYSNTSFNNLKRAISTNDPYNKRLWLNNGLEKLVSLEYKNNRVNGLSKSDSVDKAINKVIKNNFDVAVSKNSSVILNKEYIQNKSDIQDFMSNSLSMKYLQEAGVKPPKEFEDQASTLGYDANERYKQDIIKNGVWVTNEAQNGAILTKKNPDGSLVPVFNKDGKRLEMGFDDMVKFPKQARLSPRVF